MIKHKTTAKRPRTAPLHRHSLVAVIGGTNGTIIVQNGVGGTGVIAVPTIGANGVNGGGHP